MSEQLGVSSTGLRARDLRHLEEETQQQQHVYGSQQQQQQKQRRRLSQNSNMTGASYTSQRIYASRQPMDRQLSSGAGGGAGQGLGAGSDAAQSRRRRAPPSNASRTSTVLSGQAATRRIRDRQDPPTASDRGKGKEGEWVGDRRIDSTGSDNRQALRSHLHADELPIVHDSPLRRWCRLVEKTSRRANTGSKARRRSQDIREWSIALAVIVWIKWTVGLGGWSGKGHPPLFGDLEAQRHWLSITTHLPISSWYSHNLAHWGLDYPPLTAYHSFLLGRIAQLFGDPRWVGLRGVDDDVHGEERAILFMRSTVIVGDLLLWALPVAGWCAMQLGRWRSGDAESEGRSKRSSRTVMIAFYSIMLQPGLILIDSGHFQYNSIMLGLTLLAVLAFQSGQDSLGAVLFVASMCFKQMALYYAPGIFAYLLGKCFYVGGNEGMHLFTSLGFFSVASLMFFFAPFLYPLSQLSQALTRIFPFSRGLFEDKVANVWCSLNVVIKLREIASIPTLARLSAVMTLGTTMPIVLGVAWVSWQLRQGATGSQTSKNSSRSAAPTIKLLPYALFASSMAFFLFSFQVHEKSILLPLMPLTLLLAGKQPGLAGQDFEWIVLLNNVAAFSMYPLLKRDGLALPTMALTLFWNFALGYNPFSLRPSLTKYLSLVSYFACSLILFLETVTTAPKHLPDLYVVLNVLISCGIFGLGWLWSLKRLVEEAWGLVGLGGGKGTGNGHLSPTSAGHDERRRFLSPSESEYSLYDGHIAPGRESRRTSSDGRRAASPYLPEERREHSSARSASVVSSTRTARQRPTRSPLVSPQELPNEDEALHEPPPYTGTSGTFSRKSERSSRGRLASADFDAPANGFERVSRAQQHLGDVSTHVSPSKTIVPGSREAFYDGKMAEEEDRWRQGMLREFD